MVWSLITANVLKTLQSNNSWAKRSDTTWSEHHVFEISHLVEGDSDSCIKTTALLFCTALSTMTNRHLLRSDKQLFRLIIERNPFPAKNQTLRFTEWCIFRLLQWPLKLLTSQYPLVKFSSILIDFSTKFTNKKL